MSEPFRKTAKELLGEVAELHPFGPRLPQQPRRVCPRSLPGVEILLAAVEHTFQDQRIEHLFGHVTNFTEKQGQILVVFGDLPAQHLGVTK